jgi:hypothetical protein
MNPGIFMKKFAASLAAIITAVALFGPVTAAQASSIYDVATVSSLRNMVDAMTYYSYFGSTGSYEGVTASELQAQGWSPAANVEYRVWIEGTGQDYRAVAQDVRNGSQVSFTTAGSFNGRSAGSVGVSSPQPSLAPTVATFMLSDLNSSLDSDALSALLAAGGVTLSDICAATLFVPGTHQAGSSVSDQSLACESAASATGATTSSVLLALRTAGGAAALAAIAQYFVGAGTSPAIAPPWVHDTNPKPGTAPTPPQTLPPLWRLPKKAPQFAAQNGISDSVAQIVLAQCYSRVSFAGAGDPYKECSDKPIFASGRSDVDVATDHDIEALTQVPSWVGLSYRPAALNPSPSGWQSNDPACAGKTQEQNCDEYPFLATEQGGAQAVPFPSLKLINGAKNQLQGSLYSSFLATCHVTQADKEFLAIPLPPSAAALPTLAICNGH